MVFPSEVTWLKWEFSSICLGSQCFVDVKLSSLAFVAELLDLSLKIRPITRVAIGDGDNVLANLALKANLCGLRDTKALKIQRPV